MGGRIMTLHQLRVFVAVAEREHLTQAAAALLSAAPAPAEDAPGWEAVPAEARGESVYFDAWEPYLQAA